MAPVIDALIELGRISQEEALQDSRRNQLRSVVNGEEITMIDLPEQDFMLLDGDIVILASDGLQTLSNNEIADILQHNINQSPAEIVDVMLNAVEKKQKNNQDNASILICKYQEAINSYLDADSTSTEAITEKKNI
jgi:serine/threonine protein phosphatase PrpC